jgi:tRNA (cmo5U34)-methyltransferase
MPRGSWAFDASVTDAFDDMLRRSIPQYDVMRAACFDLGVRYVKDGTEIVDLGCSRGEALEPFVRKFGAFNRYVGVEVSEPMLEAARERFKSSIEIGRVEIRSNDLRHSYPPVRACLTLCVLTIQFTPIEYRQRIMRDVFRSTIPGGACILVEKILGSSAELDAMFVDEYYALKNAHGYDQEQIERKRLSLEGVLVPVTARWNEELLRDAGFAYVDCFWRWMNFAGWLAIKSS